MVRKSRRRVSRKRVSRKRVSRKRVSRRRVSRKRVSRRRANRRRIKFSAGGSGYYLGRPEISDEELFHWTTELERFPDGERMEQQQRLVIQQLMGIIEKAKKSGRVIEDARDLAQIEQNLNLREYVIIKPSYTRHIDESINRNNKFVIDALEHLFGIPTKKKQRRIADEEQLQNYNQLRKVFQQKLDHLLTRKDI